MGSIRTGLHACHLSQGGLVESSSNLYLAHVEEGLALGTTQFSILSM